MTWAWPPTLITLLFLAAATTAYMADEQLSAQITAKLGENGLNLRDRRDSA